MVSQHRDLHQALDTLEESMRCADLWPSEAPSAVAMESQTPFAIDTMPFESWLAYIFIPKMRMLLTNNLPLPVMQIGPAAEVYLAKDAEDVIRHIRNIDTIAGRDH